jgi:Class III cytochrome C family
MQIFRPGVDAIAVLCLAALGVVPVLGVGLAYQIVRSPYVTMQNVTRNQTVPFSHEHHVGGLGIDCRFCHTSVEKARFAGIPPTETCMTCHSQIWTNAQMLAPGAQAWPRTSR